MPARDEGSEHNDPPSRLNCAACEIPRQDKIAMKAAEDSGPHRKHESDENVINAIQLKLPLDGRPEAECNPQWLSKQRTWPPAINACHDCEKTTGSQWAPHPASRRPERRRDKSSRASPCTTQGITAIDRYEPLQRSEDAREHAMSHRRHAAIKDPRISAGSV